MGAGVGGGYASGSSGLGGNVERLAKKYATDAFGRFGIKDVGRSQVVVSVDPQKTAKEFFDKLSEGGKREPLVAGNGIQAKFPGGSSVVYRPTSKDGSPALNIKITGPKADTYKIHFKPLSYKTKGNQ